MGTNLYNWWNVNLCKNVSKDKKGAFSNQIPESLLERIILSTTNLGDLVARSFLWNILNQQNSHAPWTSCVGCDLNPEVIQWRPTSDEFVPIPEIPEQQYDQEYPFYKIQEAGLTEEQFNNLAIHLIENATVEQLARAPGLGKKKAQDFKNNLNAQKKVPEPPKSTKQSQLGITFEEE